MVVLPGDIALKETTTQHPRIKFRPLRSTLLPAPADLSYLAATFNSARKVTILAGAGCANTHTELIQVAEKLKAPIVQAMRGKGVYRVR